MHLRVRGPAGQSVITLDSDSTVGDLRTRIIETTSIERPDIKIGYPPRPLSLEGYGDILPLSDLDIQLNGEQLIVSQTVGTNVNIDNHHQKTKASGPKSAPENSKPNSQPSTEPSIINNQSSFSFADVGTAPPYAPPPITNSVARKPSTPLSLTRKPATMATEPPEVPLPSHSSTMTLRIMPDDNSCLFRAFGSAFFGAMDNMQELRSIIAQTIQSQPDKYPAVVLDKKPDDYCRWIQTEDAWGGFIELEILSKYFAIEICSIDVQTLRVDRFNEGSSQRCILVYSGIHYDVIARSPSDPPFKSSYAPPEFDVKIFEASEEVVLEAAVELCKVLQGRHYFTDTAAFEINCNVCGHLCIGEKGATEHAKATGHYDFGEAA
ncbi:MAG: hypothetical protein Q9195_000358 [Heterodermia aff. obscurata]